MSQRLKTLSLLRHAGERGVTNSEFIDWRIFRYAARLHELREEGYEIRTQVFGSKAVYALVSEPDGVERTASNPPDPPGNASRGVGAASTPTSAGSKAPGGSGETGLITRVSASGSLNADVDDGRGVAPETGSLSPGLGGPAAVVSADTLFPVEHEPRSPYEYEDAA
jgi:hypothetical protein